MNEWIVKWWNGFGTSVQKVMSEPYNLMNAISACGIQIYNIISIERKPNIVGNL